MIVTWLMATAELSCRTRSTESTKTRLPSGDGSYFADLVAVEGDPLKDIGAVINNVRWVMKGGVVVFDKSTLGKTN